MADAMNGLTDAFRGLSLLDRDPVWTLPEVHQDDVHGLILSGDNQIISGSKDGSVVRSTLDGHIISRYPTQGARIDYTRWLTAIARLDSDTFVEGTRDGYVFIRNNDLSIRQSWAMAPMQEHISKQRNYSRVVSFGVQPSDSEKQQFFIGLPTEFAVLKKDGTELARYTAAANDWVYVIHPISKKSILVVTGSNLSLWKKKEIWKQDSFIVQDSSRFATGHRPYISSLTQVAGHASCVAYTVFDGSVRVVDLGTQNEIAHWREHSGRVWSVVNCCDSMLASCADDKTVKLWDIRDRKSIATFNDHPGRVSALLSLGTNLVCATCPDDPRKGPGAMLICRDVRRI